MIGQASNQTKIKELLLLFGVLKLDGFRRKQEIRSMERASAQSVAFRMLKQVVMY